MIIINNNQAKTIPNQIDYSLKLTGDFFPVPHQMIDPSNPNFNFLEFINQRIKLQASAFVDGGKINLNKILSIASDKIEILKKERAKHFDSANKYDSLYTNSLLDDVEVLNKQIEDLAIQLRIMPSYKCSLKEGSTKSFNYAKYMNKDEYHTFKKILISYFDNKIPPKIEEPIKTIGKTNRKAFGWYLKKLYLDIKGSKSEIDSVYIELLMNSVDILCYNRHNKQYTYKQGYKNFTENPTTIKKYTPNY